MTSPTLQKIENFKRGMLRDLLSQCTEEQQGVFSKVFPKGIDAMNDDQIKTAIRLCERTLEGNKKEAS